MLLKKGARRASLRVRRVACVAMRPASAFHVRVPRPCSALRARYPCLSSDPARAQCRVDVVYSRDPIATIVVPQGTNLRKVLMPTTPPSRAWTSYTRAILSLLSLSLKVLTLGRFLCPPPRPPASPGPGPGPGPWQEHAVVPRTTCTVSPRRAAQEVSASLARLLCETND